MNEVYVTTVHEWICEECQHANVLDWEPGEGHIVRCGKCGKHSKVIKEG